ncbi:MAG: hypothetical protein V7K61_30665 [Nostoc sp.]
MPSIFTRSLATPHTQDRLVYATPDQPTMLQSLSVSPEAALYHGREPQN